MPVLKNLASKGATQALGLVRNVVGDAMLGRNVKQSLVRHGVRRAKRLGREVLRTGLNSLGAPSARAPSRKRQRRVTPRQRRTKRTRSNF